MRGVLLTCCLLLACSALEAKDKEGTLAFAQVVLSSDEDLAVGDSMLVSVYVYSPYRIESVSVSDGKLSIRNGRVRRLQLAQNNSQRVTYINSQPYYSVLAAQYVVKATKTGKTSLPQLKFEAVLLQQQQASGRNFSPFFGPFDDFFQVPTYKRLKQRGRSEEKKLRFVEKPAKTTEQLLQSGGKSVM